MKKTNPILTATIVTFSLFAFIFVSNPIETFAQPANPAPSTKVTSSDKYTVLAPLPCIESASTTYMDSAGNTQTNPGIKCDKGNGSLATEVDFKTYVQYTINLLIALSAVTAVVMIVWGGIEYMWSASFSDKKMGLQRAKNAVYGLLLVLTSYIILRTIDPRLVEIPNTLVPQLTINPSLLKDVNLQMIRELEDQVNKYRLREVDIENELRQLGEDKTKKRAEILAIEKEIEQLQTETPDASEKFNQLNVQKAKILEEIRKLEVEFQKKITKSAINQTVVSNLQDLAEINPDFQVGVQEKLAGANKKKSDITDYENSGKKLLGINGEFDNSYIQEQGTFGKSIIDLDSLDLLIKSSMVVNEGSVYMGSGGSLKVKLIKPNGEIESYRSVTEAKEVLKKELDRIKGNAALLTDKEILGRLDARIKEVQANLDSNPTLNGKIF